MPRDLHDVARSAAVSTASSSERSPAATVVDISVISWSFLPEQSWGRPPVRLVVDGALEDVAGNAVHELLDRDLRVRR